MPRHAGAIVSLCLLFSGAVWAAEAPAETTPATPPEAPKGIHKWVDEKGRVHYGDKPPVNAKAETVQLRETVPVLPQRETEVSGPPPQERIRSAAEQAAGARQDRQKRLQETGKQKADLEAACTRARAELERFENANIKIRRAEGQVLDLSDAEIADVGKRLKEAVNHNCR